MSPITYHDRGGVGPSLEFEVLWLHDDDGAGVDGIIRERRHDGKSVMIG